MNRTFTLRKYQSMIGIGEGFQALLTEDGKVHVWGKGQPKQLFPGEAFPLTIPVNNIYWITAQGEKLAALNEKNEVYYWDNDRYFYYKSPIRFQQISLSDDGFLGAREGSVAYYRSYQLEEPLEEIRIPQPIKMISSSSDFFWILGHLGNLYFWNKSLGLNLVETHSNITKIVSGKYFCCLLGKNNTVTTIYINDRDHNKPNLKEMMSFSKPILFLDQIIGMSSSSEWVSVWTERKFLLWKPSAADSKPFTRSCNFKNISLALSKIVMSDAKIFISFGNKIYDVEHSFKITKLSTDSSPLNYRYFRPMIVNAAIGWVKQFFFIDRSFDMSSISFQMNFILRRAISFRHEILIRQMLESGVQFGDVNRVYGVEKSLLQLALENGDIKLIEEFLSRGADVFSEWLTGGSRFIPLAMFPIFNDEVFFLNAIRRQKELHDFFSAIIQDELNSFSAILDFFRIYPFDSLCVMRIWTYAFFISVKKNFFTNARRLLYQRIPFEKNAISPAYDDLMDSKRFLDDKYSIGERIYHLYINFFRYDDLSSYQDAFAQIAKLFYSPEICFDLLKEVDEKIKERQGEFDFSLCRSTDFFILYGLKFPAEVKNFQPRHTNRLLKNILDEILNSGGINLGDNQYTFSGFVEPEFADFLVGKKHTLFGEQFLGSGISIFHGISHLFQWAIIVLAWQKGILQFSNNIEPKDLLSKSVELDNDNPGKKPWPFVFDSVLYDYRYGKEEDLRIKFLPQSAEGYLPRWGFLSPFVVQSSLMFSDLLYLSGIMQYRWQRDCWKFREYFRLERGIVIPYMVLIGSQVSSEGLFCGTTGLEIASEDTKTYYEKYSRSAVSFHEYPGVLFKEKNKPEKRSENRLFSGLTKV